MLLQDTKLYYGKLEKDITAPFLIYGAVREEDELIFILTTTGDKDMIFYKIDIIVEDKTSIILKQEAFGSLTVKQIDKKLWKELQEELPWLESISFRKLKKEGYKNYTITKEANKTEYLRNDDGSIMRTADGTPLDLDSFEDSNLDHFFKIVDRTTKVAFYEMLKAGGYIPEKRLKEVGFVKVDGEWIHKDDIKYDK